MDSSGSQDDGNKGGRRTGKRPGPMKFMFIDSTSHGTNAKPDKAVRSFVMHQARRQKPWSTRQKLMQSPSTEDAPRAGNRIQGSNQKQDDVDYDEIFPLESPWSEVIPSPSASKPQPLGSPVASISGSSNSSGSDSLQCTTPPSSHGSIYDATVHPKTPHRRQAHTALARQDGLALGVLDPFDCLVVRTDSKTSTLIDHFVSNMSTNLLPIDLHKLATKATTQWVAKSMRDATSAPFAYAMLTGTALHLRGLGVANIENPLYYKAQAISEINKLLSDPRTSIEDNNITAVFMLLCIEESQIVPGNKQHDGTDWSEMQRAIHLNGLRTMIQQRGGLASLGSNKCLQVFLLICRQHGGQRTV
ncbi:hypothetical protein CC78DRAFT_311860 [Lojkania enalia]|uniref:Uncharacterized protein n=1 Tax=Lojkania enalia TaxID=147567 RepID=A0A9P4K9N3_9PLEO|nr:hypothetical protein CC78DRAFT_311860 [Didymosphaeria enalia]